MKSLYVCLFALPSGASGLCGAAAGGAISGTVKNSSGAAVTKATVEATNIETGVRAATATNSVCFFSFSGLPVGHYNVQVAVPGFKMYRRENVVDVNSAVTVDAVLDPGASSET